MFKLTVNNYKHKEKCTKQEGKGLRKFMEDANYEKTMSFQFFLCQHKIIF